ncbi:MAG: DNA-binding response regulator [Cryomorphaceae bacterium]|nr:MAG: DNA-binding response regulator [Cryomorphaceae bacterium]
MSKRIRLVVADSNELIKIGLRTIFQEHTDIHLVESAGCTTDLMRKIAKEPADVVLMDFTSPGFDINTIPELLFRYKNLRVVAITPSQNGHTIAAALRAGVSGYVKKDCSVAEILDAVRTTASGSRFFCGQVLDAVRHESIDPESITADSISCEPILLSDREQEIITLIAEGYTNTKIAEKLFLSPHTVNTHRKNIMQKLGVNNTAAIVMFAVKNELVSTNKFLFSSQA